MVPGDDAPSAPGNDAPSAQGNGAPAPSCDDASVITEHADAPMIPDGGGRSSDFG